VLQIHLDESVKLAIADGLRMHGVDVTIPVDVDLLGASDEEHLNYARTTRRLLITHDRDFLVLAAQGVSHAGIAYCHRNARTIGQIVRRLVAMAGQMQPEDMVDRVEYL
jgi:predicted nuclease of predicted toxin-antitoxin system